MREVLLVSSTSKPLSKYLNSSQTTATLCQCWLTEQLIWIIHKQRFPDTKWIKSVHRHHRQFFVSRQIYGWCRRRGQRKRNEEGRQWGGGREMGGGMWSVTIWRTTLNAVLLVQVTDFNVTQMRLKLLCVFTALHNENCFLSSDRNKNQQNRHSLGGKSPTCLQFVCYMFRPTWTIIKDLQLTEKRRV